MVQRILNIVILVIGLSLVAHIAYAQNFVKDWVTPDSGSTDNFFCSSATNITMPLTALSAGNTIAVNIGGLSTGATQVSVNSITDSKNDVFVVSSKIDQDKAFTDIWKASNVVGGPTVVTIHLSPGGGDSGTLCSIAAIGMEFSGVDGTLDEAATNYSNSNTPDTGLTQQISNDSDLVLGAFSAPINGGIDNGPSNLTNGISPTSGWKSTPMVFTTNRKVELISVYGFTSLKGQYGVTWTTPTGSAWYGAIATMLAPGNVGSLIKPTGFKSTSSKEGLYNKARSVLRKAIDRLSLL